MNYSEVSIRRYRFSISRIAQFYSSIGATEYDPIKTADFIEASRFKCEQGDLSSPIFHNRRKVASLMDEFFHTGKFSWNVIPVWRKPTFELNSYFDEILKEFKLYWQNKNIWCRENLITQVGLVRQFFEYLQTVSISDIRKVNVQTITEYLDYAKLRHPYGLSEVGASIRFLGDFFKGVNIEAPELRLIVPAIPANRRIMPSFSDDEVVRILSAVDRTTSSGKRNYAILLLSAKLGLRAVDVAHLLLTDIDWHKPEAELKFTQHKTGKDLILPLETDVGNAIATYILEARPRTELLYLFTTVRPPCRQLTPAAVAACTQKYMQKTGVAVGEGKGTHSFRRHLATNLLNAEVEYAKICEILGHQQPHNLKSYIRTDPIGLAECALPFTEICKVTGVLQ